jgi:Tol biopolymer transport system component
MGGRDLYLLELRTKTVSPVGATEDYESAPQFSPDGKSIVYANGQPGIRADHLFVRILESGVVRQVTFGDANGSSPSFTADGKRIIFARDAHYKWGGLAPSWNGGGAVWSVGVDGSKPVVLLPENVFTMSPSMSSDGKTIVWWDSTNVFTSPMHGESAPHAVASGYPRDAAFSPRGDQIVYVDAEFAGTGRLCVVPTKGGTARILTAAGKGCIQPVFSPDGRNIYYMNDTEGGLWKIATNGTNPIEIARRPELYHPMGY